MVEYGLSVPRVASSRASPLLGRESRELEPSSFTYKVGIALLSSRDIRRVNDRPLGSTEQPGWQVDTSPWGREPLPLLLLGLLWVPRECCQLPPTSVPVWLPPTPPPRARLPPRPHRLAAALWHDHAGRGEGTLPQLLHLWLSPWREGPRTACGCH